MNDTLRELFSVCGSRLRANARQLVVLVVLASMATCALACHKGHRRNGDDLAEKPEIQAKSKGAQKVFDEAKQSLVDGEYDEAAQQFRLVQAEYADDPIAHVAELYASRAALGDLSPGRFAGDASAPEGLEQAKNRLSALSEDGDVDERVSFSARAYLAAAHALSGERATATSVLESYPGPSLSAVVLEQDRPLLLLLVADAMRRNDRSDAAIEAYAGLFGIYTTHVRDLASDAARRAPPEEGAPEAKGPFDDADAKQIEAWAHMARSYAFELADSGVEEAVLQDLLASDDAFLRAVGGWGLLRDALEAGIETDEARAAVEDLFNRVSPDMVSIGAGERAAELSTSLAAAGGPRRLAVGVVLPLTGSASGVGAKVMAGALTAVRAFSATDEPSVTLVFQDSSKPADEVFGTFESQGVSAVVGPLDRKRAVEYARAAERFEIPLMTMTAQSAGELMEQVQAGQSGDTSTEEKAGDEGGDKPFVFRNFVDPRAEARAAARLAFERAGDRKAAIVYPGIGYGRTMAEAFRGEFMELGGQIVAEIEYDRSSSDFASAARKLANSGAEAVFVPDSASKVAQLTSFFANANIWGYPIDSEPPSRSKRTHVHYLGTSLWQDPMLIRQARSYVEGASIPAWFSPTFSSGPVTRFVRRFEAIYNRRPENFEAFAHDSVSWFVTLLLERGMSRPKAIRDALLSTSRFEGVTGTARFGADGEAIRDLRFVTPGEEGFEALPFTAPTEVTERDVVESGDADEDASQTDQPGSDSP